MKVKFWGTRGSIAVPGRDTTIYGGNTTCIEVTLESGNKVVIDAGTGIRALGEKLSSNDEQLDIHLLITHIHWDHLLGFPFFSPLYRPSTTLHIDGAPNCMKGLRATFDNRMSDGFFPIKFDDLKAQIRHVDSLKGGNLTIDGVSIESIPLQHPQGGFGFRFTEKGKRLVFITDNELTEESWAERHPDSYVRFCDGADVLIHDAQYTPEERQERTGWGHSDYVAALDLAQRAHVKHFLLFHHDPSRKDPEEEAISSRCREIAQHDGTRIVINAAREGSELTV